MQALTHRHLVDRTYIKFNKDLWRKIARKTQKFYAEPLQPVTYQEVIACYAGSKKQMYVRALESLKYGFKERYCRVSMMVKPDRHPLSDIEDKAPRAIQYRSPQFNLVMSRYIKAFEHHYYETLQYGVCSGTRVIAKGLNNFERGELFYEKVQHFIQPIFILADHSKFDSTINEWHLRSTHKKYQKVFKSRTLQMVLKAQINNKCWSRHGISYVTRGTRMSGDPDTGCGNSIINADAIWGVFYCSRILKYDFLLDGDDSILIVEKQDFDKFDGHVFEQLGFETKYSFTTEIEEAEFCQCRPVRLGNSYCFVRNPERALSNMMVARRKYPMAQYNDWTSAVGMCELATNSGLPVLQHVGQQMMNVSKRQLFDSDYAWKMELLKGRPAKFVEPTLETRLSYFMAWGVPLEIQELIENTSIQVYSCQKLGSLDWQEYYISCNEQPLAAISACYQSLPESGGSSWWRCS